MGPFLRTAGQEAIITCTLSKKPRVARLTARACHHSSQSGAESAAISREGVGSFLVFPAGRSPPYAVISVSGV